MAFHHPFSKVTDRSGRFPSALVRLFSFVTQSPEEVLPGPVFGSGALPRGHAQVRGATVFLGSLLWDSASMLGFSLVEKNSGPVHFV